MAWLALILSAIVFLVLKIKNRADATDSTPAIITSAEEADVRGAEAAAAEYKRLAD